MMKMINMEIEIKMEMNIKVKKKKNIEYILYETTVQQ